MLENILEWKTDMIEIETQRLVLLQPDETVLESLIEFYVSERSSMAGGHVPFSDAVTLAYAMLGHWVHRGYGMFTISRKKDKAYAGMTGPYFPPGRPEKEVGWILFDGFEGYGYATEAANAAVEFARDTLGWTDIVHYIDLENSSSVSVAERLGAKLDTDAIQKPAHPCLVYRQPAV